MKPTIASDGSIVVNFVDNDALDQITQTIWVSLNAESLLRDFQANWLKQGYCPAVSLEREDNNAYPLWACRSNEDLLWMPDLTSKL